MWKYYALLSAVFAAATAILAKCGVQGIDSNLATAIRTTVILVLTWGIVLFTGTAERINDISSKSLLFLLASGVATGLSWLFYFKALQLGDIARVAPIDKLSVAIVVVFGIVFFREDFSWKLLLGCGCIFTGTLLILADKH